MVSLTIGGQSVIFDESTFTILKKVNERMRLQCTVLDYAGTLVLQYGEQVVATDATGVIFSGFLIDDKQDKSKSYPDVMIEHQIDTIDARVLADNRTTSRQYTTPANTGKIVLDLWADALQAEGINAYASTRYDTTQAMFAQGTLAGTQATLNVGDGDLELTPAGSIVTISESTTAQFATGTLTNVTASSNTLSPTTESAILMTTQLPVTISSVSAGATYIYQTIWSGSQVVGTLDTLNYDIWIDASSPAFNAGVDLNFSDVTTLHSYTGPVDQNAYPASTLTDLSTFAKGAWYTRNVSLTSALNGKTVTSVTIGVTGVTSGTYKLYVRNCYLSSHSGTPFFSTTATATNVNPTTTFSFLGYVPALTSVSVVQTMAGYAANRVSPAYSISATQLVASSLVTWRAYTPATATFQLAVSYDGNTFLPCTNGQPLPLLPAGSVISGTSISFMETFISGTDPTSIPALTGVTAVVNPGPAASKTDIATSYGTSTQWNSGILNYLAPNTNGDLTLGAITRNWNDNLITNQSFFQSLNATASQSASTGAYKITVPEQSGINFAQSRFDLANLLADFTAEWDTVYTSNSFGAVAFVYRTTGWSSGYDFNYGYALYMNSSNSLQLNRGSNTNSAVAGTGTGLQVVTQTFTSGTTYHFKLVVVGNNHQVYFNHATTPIINATDSTYSAGNIGFLVYGNNSGSDTVVGSIDNLVITPANFGTWTSPTVSLSSLTTIAGSAISWLETLITGAPSSTAIVQTSIDGGSTYQLCTNNAIIPGLTAGVNVSSLSLLVKITLFSTTVVGDPVIGGLGTRVLGAFPTVTGTRNTAPIGNDMSITRTVGSGWGTAFDGQAWAQVGTGTTAVATGEETITNTTGTVYMRLGSRTGTDLDGTHRFSLSSSSETAGIFLRYVDANNYYALAATTSAVSILKRLSGVTTTLATVSMTLAVNAEWRMRFRVAGSAPVSLFGNVWGDLTLEPTVNSLGQWNDSLWSLTATD